MAYYDIKVELGSGKNRLEIPCIVYRLRWGRFKNKNWMTLIENKDEKGKNVRKQYG